MCSRCIIQLSRTLWEYVQEMIVFDYIYVFTLYHSAIPYTVRVRTGDDKDSGTESNVWIRIIGTKNKHTGKQYLELVQKSGFSPGSVETFSLEGVDVGTVKKIEVCYVMCL